LQQIDQEELRDYSPEEMLDLEMELDAEAEEILMAYSNVVDGVDYDEYSDEELIESLYDLLGDLM
jgi:hypothetical protein